MVSGRPWWDVFYLQGGRTRHSSETSQQRCGKTNTKTAGELHVVDCSEGFVQVDNYNKKKSSTHFHLIQCLQHLHVWKQLQRKSTRPALYTVLFQLNKLKAPKILTFENRRKFFCVPLDYLKFINKLGQTLKTKKAHDAHKHKLVP